MGERKLDERVEKLAEEYLGYSQLRDGRLFTQFLLQGYSMTSLSSIPSSDFDNVIMCKVRLGMLITLYDDLADNPACYNPKLLKALYQLNIGSQNDPAPLLDHADQPTYELAMILFKGMETGLLTLPHFEKFYDLLVFDIQQIYLANRYSELLTQFPGMGNLSESKMYGPYNMGMLAAGMIDLMASPLLDCSETGRLREVFLQGQRLGRIGNLLATIDREIEEGDVTNEILISNCDPIDYTKSLIREFADCLQTLQKNSKLIKSIDLHSYIQGLEKLFSLHIGMKGII